MSVWTSAAHFQDPLAPSQCVPESRHNFDLSAVQISGLPGNDRPLTHTVTLRMARSFGVARWRHRSPPADTMSASAAHYLTLDQEPVAPGSCALLNRQCSPRKCASPIGARCVSHGCPLRVNITPVRVMSALPPD